MDRDRIDTSHDLADFLEGIARTLRQLPSFKLEGLEREIVGTATGPSKDRQREQKRAEPDLGILADRLRKIDRSEAETQLSELTLESIRRIAPILDIRIPSRAKKDESIEMLLVHLFDAPAGQELIRTFHKRYGRSSQVGSPGNARDLRRHPSGRGKI